MSLPNVKIVAENVQAVALGRVQELSKLVCGADVTMSTRIDDQLVPWAPTVVGHVVSSGISNVVDRILLDAAERAEKACPASGDLCLRISLAKAEEVLQNWLVQPTRDSTSRLIQDSFGDILEVALRATKVLTGTNLQGLIKQFSYNPLVNSISSEVIRLAGSSSKISVATGQVSSPTVESKRGFSFHIESPLASLIGRWQQRDVKYLLVDGILESLSEISSLLDEARERDSALVLVCRGILPDLLSVLDVNNRMGLINAVPAIVRFDEVGANVIKDIAVVLGCDVVSATKGNLVSAVRFDQLSSCAKVLIQKDRMVLQPKLVGSGFTSHLIELNRRREDISRRGEPTDALDARIRTMNSEIIKVTVPEWDSCVAFEIEKVTKHVAGLVKGGGIKISDVFPKPVAPVLQRDYDTVFPAHGVMASLRCASRACDALLNLGSFILIED